MTARAGKGELQPKPDPCNKAHLILTVADISKTISFYCDVLGMQAEKFTPADGSTRWTLNFGSQKINLHQVESEFEPKAIMAKAGSSDLCF